MRKIVFKEDFATRKKGEEIECDSMLASDLIIRDVAELKTEETPKKKEAASRKAKKA